MLIKNVCFFFLPDVTPSPHVNDNQTNLLFFAAKIITRKRMHLNISRLTLARLPPCWPASSLATLLAGRPPSQTANPAQLPAHVVSQHSQPASLSQPSPAQLASQPANQTTQAS